MAALFATFGNKARTAAQEAKPALLAVDSAGIPADLKAERRWVCWKLERREGKWSKVPHSPETRRHADSTDPKTWTDFATALGAYRATGQYDGIGFVLGDGWAGIDLDDSRDPVTGALLPWAESAVKRFDSFADVSPTATGIKIFLRGRLPVDKGKKCDPIEIYDHGRYFTVCGVPVDGSPCVVNERTELLGKFYEALEKREKEVKEQTRKVKANGRPGGVADEVELGCQIGQVNHSDVLPVLSDDEVIDLASRARNGTKFKRLWAGDTGDYAGDDSRADSALCCILAFYTRDAAQIDRLFRRSGLMREKWERSDYGSPTIARALELVTKSYKPKRRRARKAKDISTSGVDAPSGARETEGGAGEDDTHRTDTGNAKRFAADHGQDARYVHDWKKWLFWDGKRWAIDRTGEAERRAKETIKKLYDEAIAEFKAAAEALKEADAQDEALVAVLKAKTKKAKQLVAFALQSEHVSRIEAMLKLARSEPGIPILPTALDIDPWAFNVENGTINLKTGELRDHRREDLITKLAPCKFDPEANCPLWLNAVRSIFAGDDEMIRFVQRLSGYFLTGCVNEDLVPIFHGDGSNGKTVYIETERAVMGKDYADAASPDLLLVKKGERHPTEIADLHGKRLMIAQETDDGRELNEALLKRLSGKDEIKGRRMREDLWAFPPTHKLVMCTNHRPAVKGQDHAIWRRLALVPFDVTFWRADRGETGPEERRADLDLKDKLLTEKDGILSWMLVGCIDWQRHGMQIPKKVQVATEGYRTEQDSVARFIEDHCVTGPDYRVRASALYAAYCHATEHAHEGTPLPQRRFARAVTAKRFERLTNNGIWYVGIALQKDSDNDP
jgi:putative DNA primase/helicase